MSIPGQPKADETLDSIKDIQLFQAKNGYRFSVDALLLEHFIPTIHLRKGVELGTGSGVISILLARRLKKPKIVAVEIQKKMAERAIRNIHLNQVDNQIEVLSKDMMELRDIYATNSFDFVFSNPPFRKPKTGRMSLDKERAVARHEIEITLPALVKTAAYLLKHTGKFYMIYHPFRLAELISLLRTSKLEPKRVRFVHSKQGQEAKMVLIEAVKGSGVWLKIDPPLYLYGRTGNYSMEMKRILK